MSVEGCGGVLRWTRARRVAPVADALGPRVSPGRREREPGAAQPRSPRGGTPSIHESLCESAGCGNLYPSIYVSRGQELVVTMYTLQQTLFDAM